MKKFLKLMGVALLAMFVLAGCGSKKGASNKSSNTNKASGVDKQTLVVSMPASDHGWLSGVNYYAQQECRRLGLKKYKVLTSDSMNAQSSQIDNLINQKPGAIVLEPFNNELSVSAQRIVKAKIPLVVYDRKVKANYNAFVAGSNTEIGKTSADYLGKKLNGKGTIAVLHVPSSGSVSSERVGGFQKEIKAKYPGIKTVSMTADSFTQEDGLKTAKDMLTAHKHIDAVFSIDDESSLGILQAINEAKRTDIKYLSGVGGSQDYFKKIKNNKQNIQLFTATYSPTMMRTAVKEGYDLMKGKKVKKENIIPTTIVTKKNVSKYMDAKSPY